MPFTFLSGLSLFSRTTSHKPTFLGKQKQQQDASVGKRTTEPEGKSSSRVAATERLGLMEVMDLLAMDMKNEGQMKQEEVDQVLNFLGDVFRQDYLDRLSPPAGEERPVDQAG